jgi:hypothetical protein
VSALAVALVLATTWTDVSGRVRCDVPEGFTALPNQPWAFARSDGLRQLVYLPVKPVAVTPAERARQLLERVGAVAIAEAGGDAASGRMQGSTELSAAFAIARGDFTWAGVMVLGPATADVAGEAKQLAGGCQSVVPAFADGRVYDATRRLSCAVPPGAEAVEVRGAGAVKSGAWVVRLIAAQPRGKATLAELAAQWLAAAQPPALSQSVPGGRSYATATTTVVQGGVDYVMEVTAIDLGDGLVGGLGLSANAASQSQARAAVRAMLDSMTLTVAR